MRRPLIVLSLAVFAFVPATASAGVAEREPAVAGTPLQLWNGKGLAVVTSEDGSILGTIKQGSITFTDYPRGAPTAFDARTWGCEKRKRVNRKTMVCSGKDLHYSIAGGAWMAALRGRGIAASAVVSGKVLLRGTKGTFSIDMGKRQKWPLVGHTYKLG
jgi:hypothetical protein